MTSLFGTDGVRGVANADLTPDLALALGRAAGAALAPGGGTVVVGRDTRVSGPMLEAALVAGLCSAGAHVLTAGVLPTPAVSFLTTDARARAGAVISASHNPVPDNGIKFFGATGAKLDGEAEAAIEAAVAEPPSEMPTGESVGTAEPLADAHNRYLDHLLATLKGPLEGLRVVLDLAHGAATTVAPRAFREAGAQVTVIHGEPDGTRINVACGSTDLSDLAAKVVESGADIGFAFDGDADRVLAVDERGGEVDGDRILAMLGLHLKASGELPHDLVVVTVMANLGFRNALAAAGIEVVTTPVGDKHVAATMRERGAVLGGEQSGHVILGAHAATGDGILAALQVAAIVDRSDETTSALAHVFEPYPQVLISVPVRPGPDLEGATALWEAVAEAEEALGDRGRVLVRPSGTEPVVRVMVEAADPEAARSRASRLAAVVEAELS